MTTVSEKKSLPSEFDNFRSNHRETNPIRDDLIHKMNKFVVDINDLNDHITANYPNGKIEESPLRDLVCKAIEFDKQLVEIQGEMNWVNALADRAQDLIDKTETAVKNFSPKNAESLDSKEQKILLTTYKCNQVNLRTLLGYSESLNGIKKQFADLKNHTFLSLKDNISALKTGSSTGTLWRRASRYSLFREGYSPGTFQELHKDFIIGNTPTPADLPSNPSDVSSSEKSKKD